MHLDVDTARYPPAIEAAGYYVCAEGLANVDKHARATHAWITIQADGDELVVSVRDDGAGGADPQGSGLRGLADRAEALGGRFAVQDGPAGTTLVACIPLRAEGVS